MSSIQIVGGSNALSAEVDSNALRVRPLNDFEAAVAAGKAYSWANLTYDPDAKDTILGVENNSSTEDLYIEKIIIASDTTTQFVVHVASGVTMAGTAVTGVNLNRCSLNTASATAYANETGNAGADTYTYRVVTGRALANTMLTIDVGGAIVLPNDTMIGVDFTSAATGGNVTIIGYYKARS